jgi:Skp family chaperone for outer membrane proteins
MGYLCATALALTAGPAPAQAPASSAPGVCTLYREGIFGDSALGKHVGERLRQISEQDNAGLVGERSAFERDVAAFNAQRGTLPPEEAGRRAQALQARVGALQTKAESLQADLAATERDALQRILNEVAPIVTDLARQRGCGAVIDKKSVFLFLNDPSMDLTAEVVRRLDAKTTQMPVERRRAGGILTRPAQPR